MTMTSPEGFIEMLKDRPIEALIKIRNKMIKEVRYFEKRF